MDGMTLPDLRAGLAFDKLFRDIFVDNKVESRSQGLVEGVRSYMQTVLRNLFERECVRCPTLLKEADTALIGDFIKSKEDKALKAVSIAIKTGLGWVFTLDPFYLETITGVQKMVDSVRKKRQAQSSLDCPATTSSVGIVSSYFMDKMVSSENNSETFAIYSLQVCFISGQKATIHKSSCRSSGSRTSLEKELCRAGLETRTKRYYCT